VEGRTITILKSIRSCHLAATQHNNIPTENAPPRGCHNILCRRNAPAAASCIYRCIDIDDDIYSLYKCIWVRVANEREAAVLLYKSSVWERVIAAVCSYRLQVRCWPIVRHKEVGHRDGSMGGEG